MLGETVTDILEPWLIKVVVDNILQGKRLPAAPAGIVMQHIQVPEGAKITAAEQIA